MTLSQAILATLKYSDYFSFPLTLSELHSRLISSKPVSKSLLSQTLQSLLLSRQVVRSGIFYYLPGKSALVTKRLRRQKLALPLISRARSLAARISRLPGVLAIFLTGSLAMSNSETSSDFDFMIITNNNRLWLTRLLLTIYCSLFGLRRTPNSHNNSGKLCLNLYLTPNSLALPPEKRTLYSAYELIQVLPLFDPHHTHPLILSANSWLHSLLPNFVFPKPPITQPLVLPKPNPLLDFLELLAYRLQLLYMHRKITRELVAPDMAFFHPRNPGKSVVKSLQLK